ncbi:hypothetical protein LSM04_002867 [Trypanosoma melophagium]|uniref:uncharacterized protein n=1 Tax=Trypanosoma melophagium TaxID=715481 RepID=UPI003519E69A|nr:hypothetical protein LSM04_002867 [Trypanosoma melophagium]
MDGLTVADLTVEAIAEAEARLHQQTAAVERLRADLARLQAELDAAEAERTRLAAALRWRRLMAEVEADAAVAGITAALTAAVAEFRRSLQPPSGYDETCEGIPYIDTDDCGDFAPLELCVDDCLERVSQLVEKNRAEATSRRRRFSQSLTQSNHNQQPMEKKDDDAAGEVSVVEAGCRRQAMLMLLVLTVNLGHLEEQLANGVLEEGEVARETDELKENAADMWNQLLYTDSGLTEAEKDEWKTVVQTFLGAPYDTSAS